MRDNKLVKERGMKVEKKPYKSAGSCNFCSRGITSDDDIGIVKRPYGFCMADNW
jgi:hypothetical protein